MENNTTKVGLDVHKETIVAAVLPLESKRVTDTMKIENMPSNVEKMVKRLAEQGPVEFVYEAGPCGYDIHRQITKLGHACTVIAPSLIPVRPGDRVKTDRRDAEKLARLFRAGELTEIRVPTREEEAARDLVRVREDALQDRLRVRHRLGKFLLRQGRVYRKTKAWGVDHRAWVRTQQFEWASLQKTFEAFMRAVEETEARLATLDQQVYDLAQTDPYRIMVQNLRCLKGIDTLSALTLVVEVQDFRRFERAPALMKMTGLVSSENSSADRIRRGSITKAGNAHLRRVLIEAAWSYQRRNVTSANLQKRRQGCPSEVVKIAKKAQDRLHRRYWHLIQRGKPASTAVVAVARELVGFVWAIAQQSSATMGH